MSVFDPDALYRIEATLLPHDGRQSVVDLKVRAQGLGTVTGKVTSNGSSQPGAEVNLVAGPFRASTVTDSNGHYIVTGVPEAQVVATASLGNQFLSGTASANLVGDGTTLTLDVPLRPWSKVNGQVVKADGVTPAPVVASPKSHA